MNYLSITKSEVANGNGIRVCLWVSGCPHHCDGCQNPESWNFENGKPFTPYSLSCLISEINKDYCDGLTLTGGDPLAESNIIEVTDVAKTIKELFPNKTIWCYTGYDYDSVKEEEIMKYIDVLVDGKFIKPKRDISLKWRGSSNQRVIDVKKSLQAGKVVLYCD